MKTSGWPVLSLWFVVIYLVDIFLNLVVCLQKAGWLISQWTRLSIPQGEQGFVLSGSWTCWVCWRVVKVLQKCLEGSVICVTMPNCFLSQTPTCNVKGVADLDKNGVANLHWWLGMEWLTWRMENLRLILRLCKLAVLKAVHYGYAGGCAVAV